MKLRLPTRRFWRNAALPATVFVTGACVLVIEVVAVRILSPYFGNTIFSYSSILGVILAALSAGYYLGGRLSDRRPSTKLFFGLIAAGGLSVAALQLLSSAILPLLSKHLSVTSGPLIASLILFLLPACLLGMLSPFAIKLQERWNNDKGIGTIAGEMFFWSTMGSIIGSLGTGFVLVPWFGANAIVLGVSLVLIALGFIPLLLLGVKPWRDTRSTLTLAILLSVPVTSVVVATSSTSAQVLYQKDGLYEQLTVYDGYYEGRPVRFLKQDRSSGGAMYLDTDKANELVYDYTRYYSLHKLSSSPVKEALVLGGGMYSIPRALLHDLPEATVSVSEIEPTLPRISRQYFNLPDTPRLINSTEDGRRLLQHNDKQYDYIYSDVYRSLYSIPSHFTTREFFKLAHDRLNEGGIFIANVIGSTSNEKTSFTLAEIKTFQLEFPNSYFFATDSPQSSAAQNIIFVGIKGNERLDLDSEYITKHPDPVISQLKGQLIRPTDHDLNHHPTLTDDYAPVEHLISPLLSAKKLTGNRSNGIAMMDSIRQQVSFGPRHPSAPGHKQTQTYIHDQLNSVATSVDTQKWSETDPATGKRHNLVNIIARINPQADRRILVGAHYDTKYTANRDQKNPQASVPGANDAASGVAALLETARILTKEKKLAVGVDFVFFDGEEGYERPHISAEDWQPLGSTYFAKHINQTYPNKLPEVGVIIDMVCKKDLQLKREENSIAAVPKQSAAFWNIGSKLAPGIFSNTPRGPIGDDHLPLIQAGIPSFVVIDLNYPEWHTQDDTPDKCSAQSLTAVTDTLLTYIREQ